MGAQGAQACDLRNLGHLVSLLEPGDTWNSIGIGKFSIPLAATAIMWGGHVRVGLEDTNKMPDGSLATNEAMVRRDGLCVRVSRAPRAEERPSRTEGEREEEISPQMHPSRPHPRPSRP